MISSDRVRLKDIAEALALSVVTVSRALKDHPDISPATKKRVQEMADHLGYRPNVVARSLVTRRTYTIGLLIPDLMHSFFAEVCRGVERQIAGEGYRVLIANSKEDPQREELDVNSLLARQVDGLILASARSPTDLDFLQRLNESSTPFVMIDRFYPDLEVNYVGADDEQIGFLATEHLSRRGCTRIAHLRGREIPPGVGRLHGYRKALASRGLKAPDSYVQLAHGSSDTGYDAMWRLLQVEPPPDGVFCYNDPVAVGAIKAILEAGLRIPQDIAVVGVGNVRYSESFRVPLTTVDQSSLLIGERAGELLMRLILEPEPFPPERILIPPKLVVRESSAPKENLIGTKWE